jgi:hypothetical protein
MLHCDAQHNHTQHEWHISYIQQKQHLAQQRSAIMSSIIVLSVIMLSVVLRYAECRYAERRGPMKSSNPLSMLFLQLPTAIVIKLFWA